MSNCFKRDVTKLQTIKLKIDRMRRKENSLGWALPQQSIKGTRRNGNANQLLSRNSAADSIRQISNRYAEKQRRVMMYTGE
ncbi:hypothetical protein T03_9893 [Trichinella britovi]|uniref:Uncharacterized protein n=1 Tax=Trichinella britovi TaxID=45882 RepID=A0A0V1D0R1_TRIBR|nr:hypothetical protein T03_9893 [Trichinella britovi]